MNALCPFVVDFVDFVPMVRSQPRPGTRTFFSLSKETCKMWGVCMCVCVERKVQGPSAEAVSDSEKPGPWEEAATPAPQCQ